MTDAGARLPPPPPPHIWLLMDVIESFELAVNGGPVHVPHGAHVGTLLDHLALDRRKVAVERNEAIVPRSTYEQTALHPGDRIEIVHFIGGG